MSARSETAPDRARRWLRALAERPGHGVIDQLAHAVQVATRAARDGASDELVLIALLHDVGKLWPAPNHGRTGALLLKPYLSERGFQIVLHHQELNGIHYSTLESGEDHSREKHRFEPWYDLGIRFADEWDRTSFDPAYPSLPLAAFDPLIDLFLERPRVGVSFADAEAMALTMPRATGAVGRE